MDKPTRVEIDEFGELDRKLSLLALKRKEDEKRHAELKKAILAYADSQPADETVLIDGLTYTVEVSAKANERKIINMKGLHARLKDLFFALCKFTLSDIEKSVPAPELSKYVSDPERTGARRIAAVVARKAAA